MLPWSIRGGNVGRLQQEICRPVSWCLPVHGGVHGRHIILNLNLLLNVRFQARSTGKLFLAVALLDQLERLNFSWWARCVSLQGNVYMCCDDHGSSVRIQGVGGPTSNEKRYRLASPRSFGSKAHVRAHGASSLRGRVSSASRTTLTVFTSRLFPPATIDYG